MRCLQVRLSTIDFRVTVASEELEGVEESTYDHQVLKLKLGKVCLED